MPFEEWLTPAETAALDEARAAFIQRVFPLPDGRGLLPYNLFVPRGMQPGRTYPLVLFLHDLGSCSDETDRTLRQGLGAAVWAVAEEQALRPCFVLAPQFQRKIVNDEFEATEELEDTAALLAEVLARYPADPRRVYVTGQSMGCMSALEMGARRPGLFARYFLVAGQWDPARLAVLADKDLWVVVSEGDEKARPGMDAVMAALAGAGAAVDRALWDPDQGLAALEAGAQALAAGPGNVKYAVLRRRAGVPAGAASHADTWAMAYRIPAIRAWLFRSQDKEV